MTTESTNHPELLARLKEIREYVARCRASGRAEPGVPVAFNLSGGICANLGHTDVDNGARRWLRSAYERRPKFSGDARYPVPSEGSDPQGAFVRGGGGVHKWISGTYADNRFELLEFLITELEKSAPALTAHPHAELMALYAQDAARTANPGQLWQYKKVTGDWGNFSEDDPPLWVSRLTYRRHPHADLMLEWEKDQRENPGQVWQCRSNTDAAHWRDMQGTITWQESLQYRRKPKVRRIGAYEYPEPESEALPDGCTYWVPSTTSEDGASACTWRGDASDALWLARGLVHLPKEAAAAHCEAMLKGWTA